MELSLIPMVSAEIGTDAPILGPSTSMQDSPAVASDGSGYLVAWRESREGGGVWASRLTANGTLLDKTGLIVCKNGTAPDATFDGSSYVILCEGHAPALQGVYAVRVKPNGSILDSQPIAVSQMGSSGRVSRSTTGSLAVWEEWPTSVGFVYARRIAQNGSLLGGAPTLVAKKGQEADVAFDGSVHLVVWQSGGAIHAARLSSAATLLDAAPIVVTTSGGARPVVAAGASGFAVSWADGGYFGQTRIARVSAAGVVLDPSGVPVVGGTRYPDVGFDGSSFLAVFMGTGKSDVFGMRMAPSGQLLDPSPFPISGGFETEDPPRIASRSGEHLAVWPSSASGTPNNLSGRRVSASGALLGAETLEFALGANDQVSPAVASSGKDFLMVWQDARDPASADLYAERIASDTTVLDPIAIPIATTSGSQEEPAVTFAGDHYFVVWQDRRAGDLDVYGARVQLDGSVLDAGGFPIANSNASEAFPAVANIDGTSMVVWSHGGGFEPDLHGARVASNGSVLDPSGFVIAEGKGSQSGGAIGTDGTNFLVVWSHDTNSPLAKGGSNELRAALYGVDASRKSPAPIVLAAAAGNRYAPRVAFGGGVYLVTWHDERNATTAPSDWDIYATRVTPSGTVLDPDGIRVSTSSDADGWPDVTWNGSAFIVAWGADSDKRAARVDPSGVVLDPDGFVVSPTHGWAESVSAATNEQGETLIGYQHYDPSPEFRAPRARARRVTFIEGGDGGDASLPPDASADSSFADSAPVSDAQDDQPGTDGSPTSDAPRTLVARGGCGCHAPHPGPPPRSWLAMAVAAVALVRRFGKSRGGVRTHIG